MTDLHNATLTETAARIKAGEVTSLAVTEAMLDRIAALEPKLGSYATVTPDLARSQAKAADAEIAAGKSRGPLHGVPIAVKDLCFTRGIPTGCGTTILADWIPEYDATVVQRLRDAGSVLLGKLQMTEGAFADHHPKISAPKNAWNPAHWPGVSSSGSGVATAAGLCYGSLGSDTGGSIRFPSAANGITGIKPTWGRVSRYGVFPLSHSMDHIGPMTRSVGDAAAMLGVIAGHDPNDPTSLLAPVPNYLAELGQSIKGVRIGIDRRFNTDDVDAEVIASIDAAEKVLRGLGADIREIQFPPVDEIVAGWSPFCGVETAIAHEATYPARAAEYGDTLKGLIDLGRGLGAMDLGKILLARQAFAGRLAAVFQQVDLILLPAQNIASPTVAQMATLNTDPSKLLALLRYTAPLDMSGTPTISLPCGFTAAGMPLGLQLAGGPLTEGLLCRAGHAYQQATDWHKRHPKL